MLSDEDIDREFYGEKNEFGGSSEPFESDSKKSYKGEYCVWMTVISVALHSFCFILSFLPEIVILPIMFLLILIIFYSIQVLIIYFFIYFFIHLFDDILGGVGSSKTAVDAMAQEAERSAANTLKSKAIKEAKLLLKLEGKAAKMPRKVEQKMKPPSAEYVKKAPRLADWEYNQLKQQQIQVVEQSKDIKMIQQSVNEIIPKTKELIADDEEEKEEQTENEDSELLVSEIPVSRVEKAATPVKKAATPPSTPPQSVQEKPVYTKLKRREEEFVDEEGDEMLGDRVGDFFSLEALDDRMDELYGALDSVEEETVESSEGGKEVVVGVQKGSDSSNPIKWRNGRLVNDKDRFLGQIKSDEEGNGEEGEGGDARKVVKKSTSSKKVVVELTGVTMKNMLEHLETTIGFDGLFEETNLRCFSVKPSVNSALKVLRQLPLEWARKKIEYLYIQSKKRL